MIVLTKDNGIVIPNYDDLENKPKINGVTLEGDLTSAELGIDLDTTRYYTKTQSDDRFQPKGDYQPAGNYLTSVPSEYVTETELNDAIAGLGGSDIPYVVMTTQSATSTTLQYTGDLNGVINAVKNKTPYNAYFYNKATYYGVRYALYEVDFVYYDSTYDTGNFYVHSEGGGGQHRVNNLPFTFDGENYQLGNISYVVENYANVSQLDSKQDTLVSGTNIKTINGESILGSGDLTIEAGSGGTNIPVLVLDLPRDTTTGAVTGEVTIKSGNLNDIVNAYNNSTPYLIYAQTELDTYATPTDVFATDGVLTVSVISQGMDGSSTAKCWYYIQDNFDGTYFTQYMSYGQLATTDYVDIQIGNINTILENIIG